MQSAFKHLSGSGDQSWQRLLGHGAKNQKVERNDPPANFHFPYLVGRPTPYECCDGNGREMHMGGVLQSQQVVWLQQPLDRKGAQRVTAFTPSAGVIRLNTKALSVARQPRH